MFADFFDTTFFQGMTGILAANCVAVTLNSLPATLVGAKREGLRR